MLRKKALAVLFILVYVSFTVLCPLGGPSAAASSDGMEEELQGASVSDENTTPDGLEEAISKILNDKANDMLLSVTDKVYSVTTVVYGETNSYKIELSRWGIFNDGTHPTETRDGINNALLWASENGYREVILPDGTYTVAVRYHASGVSTLYNGSILIPSNMVFTMGDNTTVQIEPNSSPWYKVFGFTYKHDIVVRGGKVVGDRDNHINNLKFYLEPGGVNADGTLNNDPTKMRTAVISRAENMGLLSLFRAWKSSNIAAAGYYFYQYNDDMSVLAGSRDNGVFAAPPGRGWFGDLSVASKMIIVVDFTGQTMDPSWSDPNNPDRPSVTLDNQYYTYEFGHGFGLYASKNIYIDNVEISNMTGDGIEAGYIYKNISGGETYDLDEACENIFIQNCDIHTNRRQGISVVGSNNTYILNNKIHDIKGAAPQYGIDIEAMEGGMNIRRAPDPTDPGIPFLRVNEDIYIDGNMFYGNVGGDITNPDGWYVYITNNHFKSPAPATVGGFGKKMVITGNLFDRGTQLWMEDQIDSLIVSDNLFNEANFLFRGSKRAFIGNCVFYNGMLYGSMSSGWIGRPVTDVPQSVFTVNSHGMGNGATVYVNAGSGALPAGLSEQKLYYTVNITSNTFQLSETKGGSPVLLSTAGTDGWYVTRSTASGVVIDGLSFFSDRTDTQTTALSLSPRGGTIRNIYIQGYSVPIASAYDTNYTGVPTVIENLTAINFFFAQLPGAIYNNCTFIKGNAADRLGEDININNYVGHGKTEFKNCYFEAKSEMPVLIDKVTFMNCHFVGTNLQFYPSNIKALVFSSVFENSNIDARNASAGGVVTAVNNIMRNSNLYLKSTDKSSNNFID